MSRMQSLAELVRSWNPMGAAMLMGSLYAAALFLIGLFSCGDRPTFALNCLFLVTGAAVGWLLGFMASPYSKKEAEEISKYWKVAIAAFSGWGIAESDKVKEVFSFLIPFPPDGNTIFRILGFTTAVIVGALVTHATRRYASGAAGTN